VGVLRKFTKNAFFTHTTHIGGFFSSNRCLMTEEIKICCFMPLRFSLPENASRCLNMASSAFKVNS